MRQPEFRMNPTLRIDEVNRQCWDVIVVGAGPAGAMAARELARGGAQILLVDRVSFPRSKVCGCCVNGAAIRTFHDVGLGDLLPQAGAQPLRAIQLASAGRFAKVRLPEGVSLSRHQLDGALLRAAIDSGAEFLDQTQVLIGDAATDTRSLTLKTATVEKSVLAKAIVVAGGLGCRIFAESNKEERQATEASRIGAGTILDSATAEYDRGTIYMACHRDGYVGLVRLEDNRLDVAAALDVKAMKQHVGMATIVERILADAQMPIPDRLSSATWHGTGRLTQRRKQVTYDRCFFIGDAAGYVEPFTGEGIAWALASGQAVAPIVLELLKNADNSNAMEAWTFKHRRLISNRTRLCRFVSGLLRYPSMVRIAVRLLAWNPSLADPVVRSLNAPFNAPFNDLPAKKTIPEHHQ